MTRLATVNKRHKRRMLENARGGRQGAAEKSNGDAKSSAKQALSRTARTAPGHV